MSSNQCLEPLVCSFHPKRTLWSHWGQRCSTSTQQLTVGKSIFEKLLNNKKVGLQGCQVAKIWSEQGKFEGWTRRKRKLNKTREFFPRSKGSVWVAAEEGIRENWFVVLLQHQSSLLRSCGLLLVVSKASARHSHSQSQSGVGDDLVLEGWVTSRAPSCSTSQILWTVGDTLWDQTQSL